MYQTLVVIAKIAGFEDSSEILMTFSTAKQHYGLCSKSLDNNKQHYAIYTGIVL